MSYLIAEPLTYNEAVILIANLSQKGIYSNVTIGGLRIYIKSNNEEIEAIDICNKLNVFWLKNGNTFLSDLIEAKNEQI